VDALVMVLLGGVETVSGAVIGAVVYKALSIWLVSQTDLSKLVLGAVIVLIVVAFPKGIVGMLDTIRNRRTKSSKSALLGSRVEIAE
jgi:branched-chain amino acid transport system permease protein